MYMGSSFCLFNLGDEVWKVVLFLYNLWNVLYIKYFNFNCVVIWGFLVAISHTSFFYVVLVILGKEIDYWN